jgi:hypothetical protein
VPDYNPVNEIKGWGDDKYFLTHGQAFVGSQSPAETLAIKSQIDQEETDRKTLSSGGVIGFVAQMGAGLLDPRCCCRAGSGWMPCAAGCRSRRRRSSSARPA